MSFKNLLDRYEDRVKELYEIPPGTFNTGEPLYYNKLKPGKMSSDIKYDSRSLPITSTIRDVKRMTKFSLSTNGLLFLAKQQLLQTGNYYQYNTIINPAFVVANAVPFLHVNRSLRGSNSFLSIPDAVKGRLQKATGERAANTVNNNPGNSSVSGRVIAKRNVEKFPSGIIKGIKGNISAFKGGLSPLNTIYGDGDWNKSRPELKEKYFEKMIANTNLRLPVAVQSFLNYTGFSLSQFNPAVGSIFNSLAGARNPYPIKYTPPGTDIKAAGLKQNIQYVDKNTRLSFISSSIANKGFDKLKEPSYDMFESMLLSGSVKQNKISRKKNILDKSPLATDGPTDSESTYTDYKSFKERIRQNYPVRDFKVSYQNDIETYDISSINLPTSTATDKNSYEFISSDFKDLIDVFIEVPSKKKRVKYRAYITNVKQAVTTDIKMSNYIGRTEKYTVYNGANRTLMFSLQLYAASQDELNGMYTKLNFLTGLSYPLGLTSTNASTSPQMMQPPLVTLTIGKLYEKQPGIFKAVNMEFNELYDIDRQLPFGIKVDIEYQIIEKKTMFYDTPFYGENAWKQEEIQSLPPAPQIGSAPIRQSDINRISTTLLTNPGPLL